MKKHLQKVSADATGAFHFSSSCDIRNLVLCKPGGRRRRGGVLRVDGLAKRGRHLSRSGTRDGERDGALISNTVGFTSTNTASTEPKRGLLIRVSCVTNRMRGTQAES